MNGDSFHRPTRRHFLGMTAAAAAGLSVASAAWHWRRGERGMRASVCIAPAVEYEADLSGTITEALRAIGWDASRVRGKRVLLKPNLVETAIGHRHINTHPAVVVGAAEAFARWGAAEVIVAEGQGHQRDTHIVLDESGMTAALRSARLRFVDLNHDEVEPIPRRGGWTKLERLMLPRTLLGVDLIVSLPKLKTHHWAGMTCAMKNFFGVMPGIVYGWPKNVLHYQGIDNSILAINATVRPHLAIVDGIIGMEGDGPIMGTPKPLGALIVGDNLPAVDATCARLMMLEPRRIKYLSQASGRLGPILAHNIAQRGEAIERMRRDFAILDAPHLAGLNGA